MSGHTIKNLLDVEDSAAKFGFSPDMEARFARKDLGFEDHGISYQRLAPGVKQPFAHRHGDAEEVYVVVAGSGRVKVGGEITDIRQWDAIRVAPQTVRAFAAGPDGITFLAFGAHGTGDAEQLPAEWPD
jgi:mannose-6-phosphate isomerase-like protein (cupin superfamily)